ncbi:Mif2p [Nakaseomyces bracarensis]|uniref:Mif2p n=1 Tax=Nakaseomyces bracarensis TaxID=273131 RepID=UPI003871F64B
MDYMNLGLRSRKTGLDVKKNIQKDEYSMENIDEFFKDEDTSFLTRRKSRKSSLMPETVIEDRILPSPLTKRNRDSFRVPNSGNIIQPVLNRQDSYQQDYQAPVEVGYEEDELPATPVKITNDIDEEELAKLPKPRYRSNYDMGDDKGDIGEIELTPDRDGRGTYNDVPDLIDDDGDTSRANTTLNTSDNALLEDELEDGFMLESEEDDDYLESASNGSTSDNDDDDIDDNVNETVLNHIDSPLSSNDDEYLANESSENIYNRINEEQELRNPKETISKPYEIVEGVRRSKRVKIPPLEYWRNEKVQYKRRPHEPVLDIDKIITYNHSASEDEEDDENGLERSYKRQKKTPVVRTRPYNYIPNGKPRGRPKKPRNQNPNFQILKDIEEGENPEGEWLKHGMLEATVKDAFDMPQSELIAIAPNISQLNQKRATDEENFQLDVLFDNHKKHFASGMLKLPVNGVKKASDVNQAYVTFYVIQGVVEVSLGGKKFISTEGSSFQIPAYNEYAFKNRGMNDVKMFFVQVIIPEEDI